MDKTKSVAWWTQKLTIKRKRLNAMRRRFQRTHNIEIGESRKNAYHEEKSSYQAAIRREKLKLWKEYCNLTSSTIFKIASNKNKKAQQ